MIKVYTGEIENILHQELYKIISDLNLNEDKEVIFSVDIDCQHPKNQIKQVEEIVKDKVVKIVITYSPYVVQRFDLFRQEGEDIEFYYMNEERYLIDVTKEINVAFRSLSDPMQRIVWYKRH